MNIILEIQYLGERYAGWQRQKNAPSIQEEIEEAIFKTTGKRVDLIGSGRTDSGVHAFAQIANFHIETKLEAERFKNALNYYLPWDIRIMRSSKCREDFHARFCAKRKTYCYRINTNSVESPMEKGRAYFMGRKLNVVAMRIAASKFEGTHDFEAFRSEGSSALTTVRTVYNCEVTEERGLIELRISGNGFLYNMVRIIAGTLVEIGKGKLIDIDELLRVPDRKRAGHTAPAHALFLERVDYEEEDPFVE
ncbi:MAG: tRNA pseudouridine(38-40) synthase TruA [Filifactor alocis]|nr:tRNA pseudouridine(38-40) synthase TruA [Filifactor alocis]